MAAVSPLPNTRVIPKGWAQHHRPVADGLKTVPGVVKRISDGPAPYPKPEGWTGETQIHEAMFDVQELKREGGSVPGEQPTTDRQYLISTSVIDAPAFRAGERGDVVHVLGRQFRIVNIMFGSELWQIDLICVDNLTQQNPA